MLMYQVQENGSPAVIHQSNIWNVCTFLTFEQAKEYAHHWLGQYVNYEQNVLTDQQLKDGYNYNGYKDTIKIVEVNYVF